MSGYTPGEVDMGAMDAIADSVAVEALMNEGKIDTEWMPDFLKKDPEFMASVSRRMEALDDNNEAMFGWRFTPKDGYSPVVTFADHVWFLVEKTIKHRKHGYHNEMHVCPNCGLMRSRNRQNFKTEFYSQTAPLGIHPDACFLSMEKNIMSIRSNVGVSWRNQASTIYRKELPKIYDKRTYEHLKEDPKIHEARLEKWANQVLNRTLDELMLDNPIPHHKFAVAAKKSFDIAIKELHEDVRRKNIMIKAGLTAVADEDAKCQFSINNGIFADSEFKIQESLSDARYIIEWCLEHKLALPIHLPHGAYMYIPVREMEENRFTITDLKRPEPIQRPNTNVTIQTSFFP